MRDTLTRRARAAAAFVVGFALLGGPALVVYRIRAAPPLAQAPGDFSPPPHAVLDKVYRIVAFGSSSTFGFGASSRAMAYPLQLAGLFAGQGVPLEVVNRGINGQDIDDMMRRLDADVLSRRPNLVLWQVGSNDILTGMPVAHFSAQLHDGIERMRAAGCAVVLLGPQWSPKIVAADPGATFETAVLEAGRQEGVEVIDRAKLMQGWVADKLVTQAQLLGPDGLHASDLGYAMLARSVYERIAPRVAAAVRERVVGSAAAPHG